MCGTTKAQLVTVLYHAASGFLLEQNGHGPARGQEIDVVVGLLPDGDVVGLLDLGPAEAPRDGLDRLLLGVEVILGPLPPLPVLLPVDRRSGDWRSQGQQQGGAGLNKEGPN
jgi:hypothetical protein